MTTSVQASVPPFIASIDYSLSAQQAQESERALLEVTRMDSEAAITRTEMTRFMIRSESIASSKIERVAASAEDFARAIAGSRSNEAATSMVAASAAIGRMIDGVAARGRIEREDLLEAHRTLMRDDRLEGRYAGTIRDVQNWIGGSDYSPRGALHIPPGPERLPELLDDLIAYSNRDDVPVLAQGAIAHAQFETIHPFGDGNGRVGRALIGAILRRREVTRNSIVPIASGFSARRKDYFDALTRYRAGHVAPLLSLVSRAAESAGAEGRTSIRRISEFADDWTARVRPRSGSAAAKLIPAFLLNPVMAANEIEAAAGASTPQAYAAIAQLERDDVIHEITGRKRDRIWVATDVRAELDDLDERIRSRMTSGD